jgi:signal transduction histidine kinase
MHALRSRLGLRIFLSYLAVIFASASVLALSVTLALPGAFDRHIAGMGDMMGMMGMMGEQHDMGGLFQGFRDGVYEALILATMAAIAVAVVVSLLITRQIIAPIKALSQASHRIAAGSYAERVKLTGKHPDQLDELGQLAWDFNRMAEHLEHDETLRRQLIGDVSHELRTPLTAIKGSLEALLDGVLPSEPETFEQIHQEAERLQRIVNDLQELSQVEAGAYRLDLRSLAMADLIAIVVTRLERQFGEKAVTLVANIPDELPPVTGDSDRLIQVLTNLVGNGLQYTQAGGRVMIQAHQSGDDVHIQITDTGIGIPVEHLPYLFTRFYRVDKSRSRGGGGSGIGLTIARHLIEAHGGRIWADSQGSGYGSTFTFTLPIAAQWRENQPAHPSAQP